MDPVVHGASQCDSRRFRYVRRVRGEMAALEVPDGGLFGFRIDHIRVDTEVGRDLLYQHLAQQLHQIVGVARA